MRTSNYPNGFPHGVSIRGLPILNTHAGTVFWVNSTGGSNGNKGTKERPFSTIAYAISRCVANRGDIILVMPGHEETITAADAISLNVAGISLVGLGRGDDQPQIMFNNTAATVSIDADSVTLQNIRFTALISAVVIGLNVKAGATDAKIVGNRFDAETAGTDEFNLSIDIKAGCHRTCVEGNVFDMGIAGAVGAVKLTGASDHVVIRGNEAWGDYSTACIIGDTTLSTSVLIEDNLLVNGTGGNVGTEPGIELLTGTTGIIRRNDIVCNLATKAASIVADTCFLFDNYYNEDVTGTGGIIGTASADD